MIVTYNEVNDCLRIYQMINGKLHFAVHNFHEDGLWSPEEGLKPVDMWSQYQSYDDIRITLTRPSYKDTIIIYDDGDES